MKQPLSLFALSPVPRRAWQLGPVVSYREETLDPANAVSLAGLDYLRFSGPSRAFGRRAIAGAQLVDAAVRVRLCEVVC